MYKTVSTKAVLIHVIRKFKPGNSNWYVDAIEWIGEAMGIIGSHAQYCNKPHLVHIKEFRAKLPCGIEQIEGVAYNGHRLVRNGGINNRESCVSHLGVNTKESYTLNPNYIHTSFETGDIVIYGLSLPVDEEGYPLVPDEPLYITALGWYIMMNWLARGNKHPVFNYEMCEQRWTKFYPQAQNANFPDIDNYDIFRNRWNNLIEDIGANNHFFNSLINSETGGTTHTVPNIEDISNGV